MYHLHYLDNGYIGTISGGALTKDEVKLGLHQIVVQKDGYTTYTDLVDVKLKNIATTVITADLIPFATATVPPAPTKAAVPLAGLLSVLIAAVVLSRR